MLKCWQATSAFNPNFKNAYRYYQRVILNRWATLEEYASRLCRDAGPDAHCSLDALLESEQEPEAPPEFPPLLWFELEEILERSSEDPEALAEEFAWDVRDIRDVLRRAA